MEYRSFPHSSKEEKFSVLWTLRWEMPLPYSAEREDERKR